MDLKFSAEDEAYRLKLRSWLEDNMPSEPPPQNQDAGFAYRRDWQRKLYDGGWVGSPFTLQISDRNQVCLDLLVFSIDDPYSFTISHSELSPKQR